MADLGGVPGDQLVLVRGGGVMSVVRHATVVEALAAAVPRQGLEAGEGDVGSQLTLPRPVAVVAAAAQRVSGLLGEWARDAAVSTLLLSGAHPGNTLIPLLRNLIVRGGEEGGGGAGGMGGAMEPPAVVAQRSEWRTRRRKVLWETGTQLAQLQDPATAMQ